MNNNQLLATLSELLSTAFPSATDEARRQHVIDTFQRAVVSAQTATPVAATCPLRVNMLGRFTVVGTARATHAAAEVTEHDWVTQKAMLLMAYLCTRSGRPVSDTVLTATFWPDSDEERARGSLRNALHQIRGTLEPLSTETALIDRNRRSRTVTFSTPCVVDAEQFEAAVTEASALVEEGAVTVARERLEAALALYSGEFMEGFLDEWVLSLRSHYNEVYLRCLHLLARCHIATGSPESAERIARRALVCDNLREDIHAALIESLTAQGRRGEALRHHREAVELFERELGVVPSTLHDIYDELLAEGPTQPSFLQMGRARTQAAAPARRHGLQAVASR